MRNAQLEAAWMHFGRFLLDPVTYTVVGTDGQTVQLTALEFRILFDLMANAGKFRNSHDILHVIWGAHAEKVARNAVAVHIRRLRLKIEPDPAHPKYIITIRRKGYLFQI